MKHLYKSLVLICFVLLVCSCRKHSEHGYFLGLYQSESAESFKATEAAFDSWLLTRGLTPSSPPGGMAEWSGMHSKDDQSTWYAMPMGRNRLLLCMTANPQHGDIIASTNYNGDFTTAELADVRNRNRQLWLDMIAWFEADTKSNIVASDPKGWFSSAKLKINDAYSD